MMDVQKTWQIDVFFSIPPIWANLHSLVLVCNLTPVCTLISTKYKHFQIKKMHCLNMKGVYLILQTSLEKFSKGIIQCVYHWKDIFCHLAHGCHDCCTTESFLLKSVNVAMVFVAFELLVFRKRESHFTCLVLQCLSFIFNLLITFLLILNS